MNMLHQPEPVDKGPGNVIGRIIDPKDSPLSALETIRNQIEKVREWNTEAAMEAVKQAEQNLQGIALTCECLEMQLVSVLESRLHYPEIVKFLNQFISEFDRGPKWVSHDTYDQAVCLLERLSTDEQSS